MSPPFYFPPEVKKNMGNQVRCLGFVLLAAPSLSRKSEVGSRNSELFRLQPVPLFLFLLPRSHFEKSGLSTDILPPTMTVVWRPCRVAAFVPHTTAGQNPIHTDFPWITHKHVASRPSGISLRYTKTTKPKPPVRISKHLTGRAAHAAGWKPALHGLQKKILDNTSCAVKDCTRLTSSLGDAASVPRRRHLSGHGQVFWLPGLLLSYFLRLPMALERHSGKCRIRSRSQRRDRSSFSLDSLLSRLAGPTPILLLHFRK